MSTGTKISWTSATWNPTTGCDRVSPGCDHCYALTLAARLKRMGNPRYQNDGSPKTSGPGFALTLHPDKLDEPLRWKKPRHVFVNSMSDLFHPAVPHDFIVKVWGVMAECPRHTFQILTKRPRRMRDFLAGLSQVRGPSGKWHRLVHAMGPRRSGFGLRNVWVGTSVEDQKHADLRIPLLLQTPAAVRFLSCEPLLGPIDLRPFTNDDFDGGDLEDVLHWVIVGGESGPSFRPIDLDWARSLRDFCVRHSIPFFYKQGSGPRSEMHKELDGRTWEQMPA